MVGYTDGNTLKSQIPSPGVNATLRSNAPGVRDVPLAG